MSVTQNKKNGHIHNGKQNHQCKDCGRQFVDSFEQYLISDDTRDLMERLLLERLSLRGICRSVGVGRQWLLGFIVTQFEALPDHLHVVPIPSTADVVIQRLKVEADAMASFMQRVSRLVRSTLSFSKKLDNHIGAIKYFICNYNLLKAKA